MLRKVLIIVAVVAMVAFYASGCKKSPDESGSSPDREVEAPKSIAEYEAEAEKEITEENMLAELEKLEKEIERDIPLQP